MGYKHGFDYVGVSQSIKRDDPRILSKSKTYSGQRGPVEPSAPAPLQAQQDLTII